MDGSPDPAVSSRDLALRALLASLAGLTDVLACAPYEATWLQWVGFVLLLRALDRLPARQAALVGAVGGWSTNALLFAWLVPAVERLGGVHPAIAWPLFLLVFCVWSAGGWALLGLVDARLRQVAPTWRWALFPVAFVGCEHLWPQLFCWTSGVPQVASPLVAQSADLGGAALLGYVLLTVNAGLDAGLLWALARWRGELTRSPRAPLAWGAVVLVVCLGYGGWRRGEVTRDAGPTLSVALAQPVVTDNRLTPHSPADVQRGLEAVASQIGAGPPVDLAVFPESALWRALIDVDEVDGAAAPLEVNQEIARQAQAGRDDLARLPRLCKAPVLAGVVWWRVLPRRTLETTVIAERRNAIALADGGGLRARHDKHTLLAFGEYLPGEGVAPWLRKLLPFAGVFTPGPEPRPVEVSPDVRAGVLICYEAVPSGPSRWLVSDPGGVDLLVAPTNDVWFDGTAGPHLHAMLVRLRSIETRRPLVRAAMTGRTFAVDLDGAVVADLPPGAPGFVRATVHRPADRLARPPYARAGDAFAWAAVAIVVFVGRPRRRTQGDAARTCADPR